MQLKKGQESSHERSKTGQRSKDVLLLFEHDDGPVHVRVYGPRRGFRWRSVEYFRWRISPQHPGTWDKITWFRENDQPHLEKCVKAVRAWLKTSNP
jgi:hypothetical protein